LLLLLKITFHWLSAWHHFREVTEQFVRVDDKGGARLFLVLNGKIFLAHHVRLLEQLRNNYKLVSELKTKTIKLYNNKTIMVFIVGFLSLGFYPWALSLGFYRWVFISGPVNFILGRVNFIFGPVNFIFD
jgi:hypothetical protein